MRVRGEWAAPRGGGCWSSGEWASGEGERGPGWYMMMVAECCELTEDWLSRLDRRRRREGERTIEAEIEKESRIEKAKRYFCSRKKNGNINEN